MIQSRGVSTSASTWTSLPLMTNVVVGISRSLYTATRFEFVICERERAYALARRRKHGVGNCRCERRCSWLSDAAPLLGVLAPGREEIRLDLGHFVHTQSAIVVEVGLLHP